MMDEGADDEASWHAFCQRLSQHIAASRRTAATPTDCGPDSRPDSGLACGSGDLPLEVHITNRSGQLLECWRFTTLSSCPSSSTSSSSGASPRMASLGLAALESAVRSFLHFSPLSRLRLQQLPAAAQPQLQARISCSDAPPAAWPQPPQQHVFPLAALGPRRTGRIQVDYAPNPLTVSAVSPAPALSPAAAAPGHDAPDTTAETATATPRLPSRPEQARTATADENRHPLGAGYYGRLLQEPSQKAQAPSTPSDGSSGPTPKGSALLASRTGPPSGLSKLLKSSRSCPTTPPPMPENSTAATSEASVAAVPSGRHPERQGQHVEQVGMNFATPAIAGSPDPRRRMLDPGASTSALHAASAPSQGAEAPAFSPSAISPPKAIPRLRDRASPLGRSSLSRSSFADNDDNEDDNDHVADGDGSMLSPADSRRESRGPTPPSDGAARMRAAGRQRSAHDEGRLASSLYTLISPPMAVTRPALSSSTSPGRPSTNRGRASTSPSPHHFRGNIEESLLQGAMPSGTPTTLTGFTVKLGASGLGTVAPQVKLPLAVTFYSLAHHSVPTPYVGILDLEKALANSRLPGHYALPKAGHVQVVLCNPERTGLKVFLVPYDFQDMPPRTHTFLRQRTLVHYPATSSTPARSMLCFTIHLCFTCNKHGRLFLHRTLRMVFAGLAPDKEAQLETTVEGPSQPKYSPWPRGHRRGKVPAPASEDLHATSLPHAAGHDRKQALKTHAAAGLSSSHSSSSSGNSARRAGRPDPLAFSDTLGLDADGCSLRPPLSLRRNSSSGSQSSDTATVRASTPRSSPHSLALQTPVDGFGSAMSPTKALPSPPATTLHSPSSIIKGFAGPTLKLAANAGSGGSRPTVALGSFAFDKLSLDDRSVGVIKARSDVRAADPDGAGIVVHARNDDDAETGAAGSGDDDALY